ncbi:GNAT family N-acetyltransferase [Nocardioides sp. TF02-7]|uniref:GNAT family N-acetyltransferase n=1 Tax=Nocardioides sp. TF02-7 TaxID=2917724 RepID=UPI001F067EAF|nr:GNAT family N-acetyltransferase [Nocardioides sp. TF02-7]UMG93742.1 GNAT family N-acetyltransferase [Nocardioides sp. TF02-7]
MTTADRRPVDQPAALELVTVGYGHPDALALVERVQEEYVVRYGSPDESPLDPAMFEPPEGLFLVGYVAGTPVATGAWRRSPVRALGGTDAVEVKRMYVVPEARGAGHARRVLAELEDTARAAGHDLVVLETGLRQPEAIGLYTSSGYVEVQRFGHYSDSPCRGTSASGSDGGPEPAAAQAAAWSSCGAAEVRWPRRHRAWTTSAATTEPRVPSTRSPSVSV